MKKVPQFSVFFPCYNEEKNIKKTIIEAVKVLNKIALQWEIVVVNDGSTDKTAQIVKKLTQKDNRIRLINHKTNRGYGAAIKTGIFNCKYDLICYTDSDGQFDLCESEKFLAKIDNADLVLGFREKRSDSLYRRVLAKILWLADWFLFGLKVKDVDCGFKLFKREAIERIGELTTESAITETELVVRAKKLGLRLSEVGVKHQSRLKGNQTGGKIRVILKSSVEGLKLWYCLLTKKQKTSLFVLLILIILGSFLRFYRLAELMTYLGDEGRDMLIVMDILRGVNLPFIGPPTSVGKLFLGPIYYYFITPFVWLFRMDPVGPAVFVALLGVLTILLVYLAGKIFFDSKTGLFAALLYTISPLIVQFSRSSWNPNPMPFFTLLSLIGLFYWQKTKKPKFLYLMTLSFAVMLQLHYLTILLMPFFIFSVLKLGKRLENKKQFLYAFLILFFLVSPLIIFDLKHDFYNIRGILEIISARSTEGFSFFDLLSRTKDRLRQIFSLFFGFGEREWKTNLIVLGALIAVIINWAKLKRLTKLVICGYFVWGVLSLGFYRHSIYPHYLGFLFPFPALLIGHGFKTIFDKNKLGKVISSGLLILISIYMINKTWFNLSRPPVLNVDLVKKIVTLISKESYGEPFNFALLAESNYDSSYRYFFKLLQIPAVYEKEVAEQLFVVCEDNKVCHPEGNSKWEIALFDAAYEGKIKKVGEWQPDPLINVFRFVPEQQ